MNVAVNIDISKVVAGLNKLGVDVRSAIGDSIRKSALLIEGQSKKNSPVDTGRLRSSISTSIFPLQATIMPHVNYAIYVHQGTRFMRARPFLTDAVDEKEKEITRIFEHDLNKAVDKFNK